MEEIIFTTPTEGEYFHTQEFNPSPTKIIITRNITRFDNSSFEDLDTLKEVVFKGPRARISHRCFFACKNLEKVELPKDIKEILSYAFFNCLKLKNITLPKSVLSIGQYTFASSGLEKITFPDKMTDISRFTCADCKNLKEVILPKNLKLIHDGAFMDCTSLEEIVLPEGLLVIGRYTFNCHKNSSMSLKKVLIPQSVMQIDETSFAPGTTLLISKAQLERFSFLKDKSFGINYEITQFSLDDLIKSQSLDEFNLNAKELNKAILEKQKDL